MSNYKYYELPVCYLANGLELSLPVHEMGDGNGAVVGLSASVHGDETIGVEILRRVYEILKNEDITGTVKIMPLANPLSFEDTKRNTPLDRTNMNRVFPGSYDGTITEIQSRVMADKFITGLDYYIDVHAGGQDPEVDYVYITNDEGLSRAFLSKLLYTPKTPYTGTTSTFAAPLGIKCVTIECGGGVNKESYIEKGVKGILNMLRYSKVIKGEVEKRDDQIVIDHIHYVSPHHGGLFVPALSFEQMNTVVEGKVTIGKVYNPKTFELLEDMKAPCERNFIILMRGAVNTIHAGDFTFMIGDMAEAKPCK